MNLLKKLWDMRRPDFWTRSLGCTLILLFCGISIFLLNFERMLVSTTKHVRPLLYSAAAENWFYDSRSSFLYENQGEKQQLASNIAILSIDDASLSAIGRWPWSRTIHADILHRLQQAGARAVFFDVFFPEPETYCKGEISLAPDDAFAAAIKAFQEQEQKGAVIVGYTLTENPDEKMAEAPVEALLNNNILGGSLGPEAKFFHGFPYINKFMFPNKTLLDASVRLAFLENRPDVDGVFRHANLFSNTDDFLVMGAGLALYYHYWKRTPTDSIVADVNPYPSLSNPFALRMKRQGEAERIIPINTLGEVRVRYLGAEHSFVRFSMKDFLQADFTNPPVLEDWQNKLQEKAIIVGSEAIGAHDLRHTPVSPTMPGLYVHANVFNMLNTGKLYKAASSSIYISLALLGAGILLVVISNSLLGPLGQLLTLLGFIAGIYSIDHYYWIPLGYRLALFFIFAGTLGVYIWLNFLNILAEIRERLKIRAAFTRYVATDVVKEVLANPDKLKLGGERRNISMLFSDVRSFTSISEQLTPQQLTLLLNTYMNRMTDVLFESRGTLDKYIGDAMVAFWGAPLEVPDHPVRAVTAAVAMLELLPVLNEEFKAKGLPTLSIGIGINTGEVSVGNMGSDKIFSYTALGDHMNLASRLESLTKHYHTELLVSQYTVDAIGPEIANFQMRPLDCVRVKGREEPVTIYEVLPSHNPLYHEPQLLAAFANAHAAYLAKDFSLALELLAPALAKYPADWHFKSLAERCQALVGQALPDDWTGVKTFTEK